MLLCQVILLCLMPDNFMCQGKSKCNSKQNRFASDQAAEIKEKIYLNSIYLLPTKRLYNVNNHFPTLVNICCMISLVKGTKFIPQHNLVSSSVSIIYFSVNFRKRMLNDLLRFDAKDCSWGR